MSSTVLGSLRYRQDYLLPGPVYAPLSTADQHWPLVRIQRFCAAPARLEWVLKEVPKHHQNVSITKGRGRGEHANAQHS